MRKKSHNKIRLGEFEIPRKVKISVPTGFSHPSLTDSKEPQNALLQIVVQYRVFNENQSYFTQQGS